MADYDAEAIWGNLGGEMDNQYEDDSMDHSMHAMHGMHGMNHGDMGHMMAMNFHSSHKGIVYLFESWKIETEGHLWFYSVLTLVLGMVVELIKNRRLKLAVIDAKISHLADSILYFIQTALGYCLMLVAMTFHYALFFSVILGLSIGYFVFNLKRDEDPEFKEIARRESIKGECC